MSILLGCVSYEDRMRIQGELTSSTRLGAYLRRELSRIDRELRIVSGADFQRYQGAAQVLQDLLDLEETNPR